jgi:hypothetical protein
VKLSESVRREFDVDNIASDYIIDFSVGEIVDRVI